MRKVTVSRMRERYAQTVLTFRITYVHYNELQRVNPDIRKIEIASGSDVECFVNTSSSSSNTYGVVLSLVSLRQNRRRHNRLESAVKAYFLRYRITCDKKNKADGFSSPITFRMTLAPSGDVVEQHQGVCLCNGDWCGVGTEYIGLSVKFI